MPLSDVIEKANEFNDKYGEMLEKERRFFVENREEIDEIINFASEVVETGREIRELLDSETGELNEAALSTVTEQTVEYIRRIHAIERRFAQMKVRAHQLDRLSDLDAGLATSLAGDVKDIAEILGSFEDLTEGLFDQFSDIEGFGDE